MKVNIVINRKYPKPTYTIGKMSVNGLPFCDTIEDKDRGLTLDMSLAAIKAGKVYGQTAIPKGKYEVKLTYSPKFSKNTWGKRYKGMVPQVMNVPCWEGVRIHPFNTAEESLGCIAPGKNTVKGKVTTSTIYYYKLMDEYIVPASRRGDKITLEIV